MGEEGNRQNPNYPRLIIPSSEQARANGSKGGKESQKTHKLKKSLKLVAQSILDMKAELPEEAKDKLRTIFPDIDEEEFTARTVALLALYNRLLKGDPKAFEVFRDTAGEMPTKPIDLKAQVTGIDISFEGPEENYTDLENEENDELDTQKDALEKQE